MRLIDADALLEKFNEKADMAECLVDARTAERFATFCALADAVEEMPTVDAEVVVRCKDCKHYDMGVCLKIYSDGNAHPEAWQSRKPENFCSYGERKDDDNDT